MATNINTSKLRILVAYLKAWTVIPIGRHLDTNGFAGVLSGAFSQQSHQTAEDHLVTCLKCATEALTISSANDKITRAEIADLKKGFNWFRASREG